MKDDLSKKISAEEFVGLLASNQRKLFAYIMSLVANVNDADDVLQETVKMMWEKYEQFESGTDFLAWATTLAYYRVLEFRKRKNQSKIIFDDEIFAVLQKQARMELRDTDDYLVYLRQCLKKLSANDVSLVKIRYADNVAIKEIASRFGRSLQSVYRSIARVQSLLRDCIRQQRVSEG